MSINSGMILRTGQLTRQTKLPMTLVNMTGILSLRVKKAKELLIFPERGGRGGGMSGRAAEAVILDEVESRVL